MRLTLSTRHPRNSAYITDTGVVLYKIDKPLNLGPTVATIRKAVGTVDGIWQGKLELPDVNPKLPVQDNGVPLGVNGMPLFEGHFAFYAQVEFRKFQPTHFRYDGRDVSISEYFRKEGWSCYGKDRVFKASDGKEYRWQLRAGCLDMVLNDRSKKQVVKYTEYRPELGPIMRGRPGTLEIDPSCESILDEIVMTFIYCHKLRKDSKD